MPPKEVGKMKNFFIRNKARIIKVLELLGIVIAISLATFGILLLCGVMKIGADGVEFNAALFESFKYTWYGIALFVILQAIITVLLCVIPGVSMAIIVACTLLYDVWWHAFLISFVSVMSSSAFMYFVGRFGGYKICEKMLGKDDCEQATELLRNKGTVYFPLMMAFPAFPDDALVMIAGVTKMSLKWFIPSIIIGRGVGIYTIVRGLSIVPFDSFTGIYDWFILITVCAFWVILLFYLAHKLNVKMEKNREAAAKKEAEAKAETAENGTSTDENNAETAGEAIAAKALKSVEENNKNSAAEEETAATDNENK